MTDRMDVYNRGYTDREMAELLGISMAFMWEWRKLYE